MFSDIYANLMVAIKTFKIDIHNRARIEKEYKHRTENVIRSMPLEVENIVPYMFYYYPVTKHYSIATCVGTEYMNYRREKAWKEFDEVMEKLEICINLSFLDLKNLSAVSDLHMITKEDIME